MYGSGIKSTWKDKIIAQGQTVLGGFKRLKKPYRMWELICEANRWQRYPFIIEKRTSCGKSLLLFSLVVMVLDIHLNVLWLFEIQICKIFFWPHLHSPVRLFMVPQAWTQWHYFSTYLSSKIWYLGNVFLARELILRKVNHGISWNSWGVAGAILSTDATWELTVL